VVSPSGADAKLMASAQLQTLMSKSLAQTYCSKVTDKNNKRTPFLLPLGAKIQPNQTQHGDRGDWYHFSCSYMCSHSM